MPDPRVAFLQDGSRLHYAIPVALERAGCLERVFCDWFAPPGSWSRRWVTAARWFRPAVAARLASRYHPELPLGKVVSAPLLGLWTPLRRRAFQTDEAFWQWQSAQVGRWVRRRGFGSANILAGFIRNVHPDLWQAARAQGLKTSGDQIIAPAVVEQSQGRKERERWPGWETPGREPDYGLVRELEEATWRNLDQVTCASDYVRGSLVDCGVPSERIEVIPYPVDTSTFTATDRRRRTGPLKVGFVGGVNLRKGAPYFAALAKRLKSKALEFIMVGPVGLCNQGRGELGPAVELVGSVPRAEVLRYLAEFDIFLFPSTCEGSAGAIMEAMASGLPVVCSPESGSVVRDGVDGFVVPYDQLDALAARVEQLAGNCELRHELGQAARAHAERLGLDHYAAAIGSVMGKLVLQLT